MSCTKTTVNSTTDLNNTTLNTSGNDFTTDENTTSVMNSTTEETTTTTMDLLEITGVTLSDEQFVYDGTEKSLTVSGNVPDGVDISYTNNNKTDAGVYEVIATLGGDGYEQKTLTATLTITKATLQNIEFYDKTYEYDGFEKEIIVDGFLPAGVTVSYTDNIAIDAGEYDATAYIDGGNNYESVELNAKLTITARETQQYIYAVGDKVYFGNELDSGALYCYDFSLASDNLYKVNSDNAEHFTTYDGDTYYINDSIFSSVAKLRSDGVKTTVYNRQVSDLVSDGTTLFFSDNGLFGDNGIYRLSFVDDEPVIELVSAVKAKYMVVDSDYIYFSNLSDNGKLYKVSKTANDVEPTKLLDEKITYLIIDQDVLYFNQHTLLNNSICSIKTDGTEFETITQNSGKYLQKYGNYIYYSNVDLLTSNIFGKGLYKVSITLGLSTKVLDDEDTRISSIYIENDMMYYYNVDNKHIIAYDLSTDDTQDLMADFVLEEAEILGMSGTTATYENYVFFQNFYDNHKLYRYDTVNDTLTRITSTEVDEIRVVGDFLYYRSVSYFVNKDLYRINLKTGEVSIMTTDDISDFYIYNNKLYGVDYSDDNRVVKMDLNGENLETVMLLDHDASNVRVYNDLIYFVYDEYLYTMNLDGTDLNKLVDHKVISFEIFGDKVYYRREASSIFSSRHLSVVNTDGTNQMDLIDDDPKSINVVNNYVYYYNDQALSFGIYRYNLNTEQVELVVDTVAENIVISGNKMYYYKSSSGDLINGDGHFYSADLDGNNETKIK